MPRTLDEADMTPNTDRMNQIAKRLKQAGNLVLQIVVGVPVLIAMWLFAQFVKLRLWMKGY